MKVDIVCIVDRSGSMEAICEDAIGGFNRFLREQKEQPGEARLTLALFSEGYELRYNAAPIADVAELTKYTYRPGGSTALLDAIGRTVTEARARIKGGWGRPDKVVCLIVTDGHENASQEWTNQRIRALTKEAEAEHGWEFVYIGANQDAFSVATSLGIGRQNTATAASGAAGMRAAFVSASTYTTGTRGTMDWAETAKANPDFLKQTYDAALADEEKSKP